MKAHELKLDFKYFEDAKSGKKNFVIRKNNRDYKVGDVLKKRAFMPGLKTYVKWGEVIDPLNNFRMSHYYISCAKEEADSITQKVKEVITAEQLNQGDWDDETLEAMRNINWPNVMEVLVDYFDTDHMPDGYVLMEVEVIK